MVVLKEKYTPYTIDNYRYQNKDSKNVEEIIRQESREELFECYYCNNFQPTINQKEDEKHEVLNHPNKLSYSSLVDLKRMNMSLKGKKWKI